ncbi:MAG: hypothetical protein ABSE53_18285 [Terracidiphilus sp.]
MKKFLAVVVFCLPAVGQAAYSGSGLYSGSAVYGGGASITYSGYTGTDPIAWPSPLPTVSTDATGLYRVPTVLYDNSYSVAHPGAPQKPFLRCTDANTANAASNGTKSWFAGAGDSGNGVLWNANSTLLGAQIPGSERALILFDPTAETCSMAITKDQNTAGCSSGCANMEDFGGSGQFDRNDSTLWWMFGSNTTDLRTVDSTQVTPVHINGMATPPASQPAVSTLSYTIGSPVGDLIRGTPYNPLATDTNVSAWHASTSYPYGVYVTYTLVAGTDYKAWAVGVTYALGDITWMNSCAYKLTAGAGTVQTGATFPVHACSDATVTDTTSGMTWTDLGQEGYSGGTAATGPMFTFQLTAPSTGGTSGASTPQFISASYGHPPLNSTVSDNGLTWTNVGPTVRPNWTDLSGVSADSTKFAMAMSTNSYSASAGQDTGFYVVVFNSAANNYELLNTMTGIQTNYVCSAALGPCTPSTAGLVGGGVNWTTLVGDGTTCQFEIHDDKSNYDGTRVYLINTQGTNQFGTACTGSNATSGNYFVWSPFQTFSNLTTLEQVKSDGHEGMGNTHMFSHAYQAVYGYDTGMQGMLVDLTNPSAQQAISWQSENCLTAAPFTAPSCANPIDNHFGWIYNPGGQDLTPVCGTSTNVNTLDPRQVLSGVSSWPGTAWQDEVMCASTNPTLMPNTSQTASWLTDAACQSWGSSPWYPSFCAAQTQWRFMHGFNLGTSADFATQFAIPENSQDGNWIAWSTDYDGLLGSTTGAVPALCSGMSGYGGLGAPTGTCVPVMPSPAPTCFGGLTYIPYAYGYTLGTMIDPIGGASGTGANYGVFQAVAVTGNSAGTVTNATWNAAVLGGTITDGGVVWQLIANTPNCRGDVFVVKASG